MELIGDLDRFLKYARQVGHVDVVRKLTNVEGIRGGRYYKAVAMRYDYIVKKNKNKKYVLVEVARSSKGGFVKQPLLSRLI